MHTRRLVAVLLVLLLAGIVPADAARKKKRNCRRLCQDTIAACVAENTCDDLPRRRDKRRCKRACKTDTLQACRVDTDASRCVPPPPVTSTTTRTARHTVFVLSIRKRLPHPHCAEYLRLRREQAIRQGTQHIDIPESSAGGDARPKRIIPVRAGKLTLADQLLFCGTHLRYRWIDTSIGRKSSPQEKAKGRAATRAALAD